MMLRPLNLTLALACLAALLIATVPAQAYIDPGTGSYVFQIVIAAAVAGAFAFKSFFQRLLAMRSGKAPSAPEAAKHEQ